MKRSLYDLIDEPLTMFVNKVCDVLKDEGIHYNIVGGVAVQAYILDMLTKKYGEDVLRIAEDGGVRVQDYIRGTDDVDVVLSLQGEDVEKIKRINSILPKFAYEDISPSGESIIEFRTERVGASRPKYRVYVDDIGNQEDVIAMNISRGQKKDLHKLDYFWYDEFLKHSKELNIPFFKEFGLKINVPKLEHLLSSKIAQSRAKDLMDNQNLSTLVKDSGIELDFNEIEKILMPYHEGVYRRFLDAEYPSESEKLK